MKKLFTILLLIISLAVNATTWYISPSGNDATGNGSSAAPWKTLFKATSTVTTAGDIIHVNAGTYTEAQASFLKPGVSIEGDTKTTAIIKSSLTGTWSTFLTLESPDGTNGNQSISNLTLDGQYVSESNVKTWVGIWVTGRSNVLIHDCIIKNWKQSGTIFNGNGSHTNPGTDVGQPFATGNKYYNNTTSNSSAMYNGTGQGALMLGFQTGMEIYGNNISQTQRVNFANGWPIKYWNQGWLRGTKIYNNTITKIPYSGSYPGENGNWDFAIEFFNASGTEFYGNTIQGAIDLAYNYKGNYPYCVWIHDNNLTHAVLGTKVEGAIILEYRAETAIIENNTINNKTYGVSFNTRSVAENGDDRYYLNPTPVGGYSLISNCIVRNNLFTNIYSGTGSGNRFAVGVIHDNKGVVNDCQIDGLKIYHNTMIGKSGNPAIIGIDFTSMQNGKGTGIEVWDNIAVGFSDSWLRGSNPSPGISSISIRNNIVFGNGNNNAANWPGGQPSTYIFTGNKITDPLLDASFIPKIGSPAIFGATDGTNIGYTAGGIVPPPPPPTNLPPIANAGPDQVITLPVNTVTLQGSGSDQDGTIASYQWKLGSAVIGNTNPMVMANLVAGDYDVSLTVTDNMGATASDIVHIKVNPAVVVPPPPPVKVLVAVITTYNPNGTVIKTIKIYSDGSSD